jgi:PAS domain S-box-containing protein
MWAKKREHLRSLIGRFGLPILLVALATLVSLIFQDFLGPSSILLFVAAAVISAGYRGFGPGVFAAFLGCVASTVLLPSGWGVFNDPLRLAFFLLIAVTLCAMIEGLRDTHRHKDDAVRKLAENEDRYRRLLDTAREGIWMLDASGRTKYANRRLTEMLGYPAEALLDRPYWEFMPPGDQQSARRAWGRGHNGSREPSGVCFLRLDGSKFWAQITISPSTEGADSADDVLAVITDITSRKQADDKARFIADASQVLASSLDYEGTIRSVARLAVPELADWCAVDMLAADGSVQRLAIVHGHAALEAKAWELTRHLKRSREDGDIKKSLRSGKPILHTEVTDEILERNAEDPEHLRFLRDMGIVSAMFVPLRARGRTLGAITLLMSESKRRFGQADLPVAESLARRATLAVDNALLYREAQKEISERRQVEGALRASEERLRLALVAGRMGVWDWNLRTGSVDWTDTLELIHGLPPGIFTGTPGEGEEWIHPDDRERVRHAARRALRERSEYTAEFRTIWPGKPVRWLAGRGKVFCDEAGQPVRMLGVALDITERKKVEEELHRANQAKDEFLAMLAHELRNPLAPLMNALQFMDLRADDALAVAEARALAERQVRNMTRLVDDLLDVSRITRGKIDLRKEIVDLVAIVSNAMEASRPLIDARRHILSVVVPPEPIFVEADATRLDQIFTNLLNNAAKYTDPEGRIEIAVELQEAVVVVRVQDSGIGIPEEMLPRVFDLFVQASRSLDRSQGGLGIGLTLVRSLVEMHGGTVQACSDGEGQGSEFLVRLPVVANLPARQGPRPAPAPKTNGQHARILVVDDNLDASMSLAMLLEVSGHMVCTAADGPSALAKASSFNPNVVLLDIGLPQMDGYEVARLLRQQPGSNIEMLVALTGYGGQEDRRRSKEAGFDRHLVKPLDPSDLEKLLDEWHMRGEEVVEEPVELADATTSAV